MNGVKVKCKWRGKDYTRNKEEGGRKKEPRRCKWAHGIFQVVRANAIAKQKGEINESKQFHMIRRKENS